MKVLKIGGSFITRKAGYRQPEPENIRSFARAVGRIWKNGVRNFVLVHGAGSFGHALVLKYGINDGIKSGKDRLGYADTHAACAELSALVVQALINEGVPAVSIPPAGIIQQKGKRISRFDERPVKGLLKMGMLPVLYGDMVPDSELVGSVCSGDQIVARLGRGAEFMVLATNVDGVLDDSGRVIPKITASGFPQIAKHLKGIDNDVTGGMAGKIRELLALKTVSYIVNAAHPERMEHLMLGNHKGVVCTELRKR